MVLCKSLPLLDNFKIILKQEVIGGSFFQYGENSQSKQVTKQESQSCWLLKPCKNRRLEVYRGGG